MNKEQKEKFFKFEMGAKVKILPALNLGTSTVLDVVMAHGFAMLDMSGMTTFYPSRRLERLQAADDRMYLAEVTNYTNPT